MPARKPRQPRSIVPGHCMSRTKVYNAYIHMIHRCYNPDDVNHHNYGGRGIRVCDRWLKGFECFYSDMGDPPPGASLDRKDNNGDYCKENCQWASKAHQLKNRRLTLYFSFRGEQVTLAELSARFGIRRRILYYRVVRHGWDLERALATPVRGCRRDVLAPAA